MAADHENSRIPTAIYSYAYTPTCPVHGCAMEPYKYGAKVVYFRCPLRADGCRRNDKAPKVLFVPNTGQR